MGLARVEGFLSVGLEGGVAEPFARVQGDEDHAHEGVRLLLIFLDLRSGASIMAGAFPASSEVAQHLSQNDDDEKEHRRRSVCNKEE